MKYTRQRFLVLVASLSLSALLVGCLVGAMVVWHSLGEQLRDPELLRKRLAEIAGEEEAPSTGPPKALVRVSTARKKRVQPQRSIIGRLVAVQKVTLASEVTGKIIGMPVEEGTPVFANKTVLARIDDVWSRLALARSKAKVQSISARLQYAVSELERIEKLRDQAAISQSQLEEDQAAVTDLEAQLAEAKAAVEEEQERLERAEILAPFDGVVVAKHSELGKHVSPGTPIVDIVSRGEIDARLMVPESVVNRIHVGATLPIWIDPLDDEVVGQVASVTPYGPSASRTFPVRVRLDDQDGRLKAGMSVTAFVATGPQREALVVPKDGVLVRPDGSTVWVAVGEKDHESVQVHPVPVSLSVRLPSEYAVEPETERGRRLLTSGASVVIEGAERLMPNQEARIVKDQRDAPNVVEKSDVKPAEPAAAPSPPGQETRSAKEG